MVIVEGPDGGGKTTLAKRLCEELLLEYRRPPEELLSSSTGPSPGLVEWWRNELRAASLYRRRGVYDRCFWISEPIYSTASVRKPLCEPGEVWRGIADLWAENPCLLFCMTDEIAMIENTYAGGRPRLADLEGKDIQTMKNINFLYWATYAVWEQASNHVVQYDYLRDGSLDVVFDAVRIHRKVTR